MKRGLILLMIISIFLFNGCEMDLDWRQDEAQNNKIQPPEKIKEKLPERDVIFILKSKTQ